MPIKLSGKKQRKTCKSTKGSVLPATAEPQTALKPSQLMWCSRPGSEGNELNPRLASPRGCAAGLPQLPSLPVALGPSSLPAAFADISSVPSAPSQAALPRVWARPAHSWWCCCTAGAGLQDSPGLAARRWVALPRPLFSEAQRNRAQTAGLKDPGSHPSTGCAVSRLLRHLSRGSAECWQCGRNKDTNNGTENETTKIPFGLAY